MNDGTASAAPAAPAAPATPPAAPAAAPAAADWTAGLDDAGKASVAKNGYKSLGDLVKGHDNFQRHFGADKVVLPGKDAKPEEWDPVYNRLGRPEKPEGYEFAKPEGFEGYSDDTAKAFRELAHKTGLSARQASTLHDWFVSQQAEGERARFAADDARYDETMGKLKEAWGAQLDENLQFANRAIGAYPGLLDELTAGGLSNSPAMTRALAELGRAKFSEDGLIGDRTGGAGGGANTPEQARAEIQRLNADEYHLKAFYEPRNPGHKAARETMERLYKTAYPESASA